MPSAFVFANNAQTTIPGAITNVATSITVQSGAAFSAPGTNQQFVARIDNTGTPGSTVYEYVQVTANSANVFTVVRGRESTSAFAFAAGATITQVVTAGTINGGLPVKLDEQLPTTNTVTLINPIPAGFRHLLVEWYVRGDTAAVNFQVLLRPNGDSTASYDYTELLTGGAGAASSTETLAATSMRIGYAPGANATANYFGTGEAKIKNYASAVGNKPISARSEWGESNLTGVAARSSITSGKWQTVATPITYLTFVASAGNFVTGSIVTLYGIP